jgi:predicted transcriptional regulator
LTLRKTSIMMRRMRTTLTLDPDVSRLIDEAVHRERRPMKQVVNDALRQALAPQSKRQRVRVTAHRSAVRAGFDPDRMNQLADELEDEALLDGARHSR